MVLQKKLDYGFHGYQAPVVPRATRSARRRDSILKKSEENEMCAFDLLATVAEELLLEGETAHAVVVNSNVADERLNRGNSMKLENFDPGTCHKSDFLPEQGIQAHNQNLNSTDFPGHQNDVSTRLTSVSTTPDCSEKINFTKKLLTCKADSEIGGFGCKIEVDFTGYRNSSNCIIVDDTINHIKIEPLKSAKVSIVSEAYSEDPMDWEGKPNVPVSSVSNAKVSLCTDHISGSSPSFGNDVKLASRDDDENSFRPPPSPQIGDRRIKKILASKYCKVAPKLMGQKIANTSRNFNSLYRTRESCYKSQMSQRNYPFKKRRLSRSISNSGRGSRNGGISYSLKRGFCGDGIGSRSKLHGVTGSLSSGAGQNTSFKSRDSHVKLRIKSFRVPEFFIEMPETATVGLLKRRVMEAVTAILSGGLRVGVLLQGKKVRDDSKTLLQTGISHDNQQLDALGFALEPNSSQAPPPPLCTGNNACLLPPCTAGPLTRYFPPSTVVLQGNSDSYVESDHNSAPSPTDMALENFATHYKGLAPLSALNVEALSMTPMHRTSKHSDASQRRIRRPFSVFEVEALVEAVEKLGTGRWRDVKIRAFDNANHRTYVDLKDKWKTLVHTARISPQQRRGEPVPQELLDRVLIAHSFWTQQQHTAR